MHRSHKGLETGNRYRETIIRNHEEFTGVNELWWNPGSGAVQTEPSLAPARASSSLVTLAPFCPLILPRVPSRFLLLNDTIDSSEAELRSWLRGSPSLPAAVLADVVLPLSDLWGILENAEGVSLPQWGSSLGKSPLIMYFFPCYGSQSSLRPSCFRWAKDSFRIKCFLHFLHHELFSVSVSPTPTSVYWGERTLVPGYFSAVYLLKFHFMGVVVVWQSPLWVVTVQACLGSFIALTWTFFPPLFFFFMCVCVIQASSLQTLKPYFINQ